ncbi:hypothetical protein AB0F17_50730 [Nonomuraea sp. NPDC026600]|uniref:hypothetical protein n=1 Tax=Nonomuraea sp. NPDC026600 TaxID=3155363 RepID=UPI0033E7FFE7
MLVAMFPTRLIATLAAAIVTGGTFRRPLPLARMRSASWLRHAGFNTQERG